VKKKSWNVPTESELSEIIEDDPIEKIKISVVIELIEDMLGTVPKNKKIYTDHVAEKMGDYQGKPLKAMDDLNEEIESCPDNFEKAATGFHSDSFGLLIYDYMILGNIKSNISVLMSNGYDKVFNYKKSTDLFCSIEPRKIRFYRKDCSKYLKIHDNCLERSLRAQTPKGPRVCLAKSDSVNSGTRLKFYVNLLKNDRGLTAKVLIEALKLGKLNGIGQWRGSGKYGRYKIISIKYV
jgi:hypothetical protein